MLATLRPVLLTAALVAVPGAAHAADYACEGLIPVGQTMPDPSRTAWAFKEATHRNA